MYELGLGHSGLGSHKDVRHLVGPRHEVLLGGGQCEGGEGDPAKAGLGAEIGDADDADRHRIRRLYGRAVTEPQTPLVGRAPVDDERREHEASRHDR